MTSVTHMSPTWRRFLIRQLPGAMIALTLIVELLAFTLDGIPFRRHDLDRLALDVEISDPTAASPRRIIVIGDSVTQDIFKTYTIGASGDVANLTTNKASGMVGAYLLLGRYLEHQPAPRHLVIASTPEFFTFRPDGETARVYLTTVFRRPAEVELLTEYLAEKGPPYSPAILNMDEGLGLKFLALLAPSPQGVSMGEKVPDPDLHSRPRELPTLVREDIIHRAQNTLNIPEVNFGVLKNICALAEEFKFSIKILIAPIPQSTYELWKESKILSRFESGRDAFLKADCPQAQVIDQGNLFLVPDEAMRDSDHLVRHGWTNYYAVILDNLIRAFP